MINPELLQLFCCKVLNLSGCDIGLQLKKIGCAVSLLISEAWRIFKGDNLRSFFFNKKKKSWLDMDVYEIISLKLYLATVPITLNILVLFGMTIVLIHGNSGVKNPKPLQWFIM